MKRRNSFTLMEMLAAIAVLAIVGAICGVSLNTLAKSWERARKAADRLGRNQAIDRFAENYLRNIIPFRWKLEENGEEEILFRGDGVELYASCQQRVYGKTDYPFLFFRLYCEEEKLKCDYSSTPLLPDTPLINGQILHTETLAANLRSLKFMFADYDGEQLTWQESWPEDREAVPLAIQLILEFTDGSREAWLRRTAGSAAGSVFGDRPDLEATQ